MRKGEEFLVSPVKDGRENNVESKQCRSKVENLRKHGCGGMKKRKSKTMIKGESFAQMPSTGLGP